MAGRAWKAMLLVAALAPVALCAAGRRPLADGLPDEIRGAVLTRSGALVTWGDSLSVWHPADGSRRVVDASKAGFGEGGCLFDADSDGEPDLVVQERTGLGRLVWRRGPGFDHSLPIDEATEAHDCLAAELYGRRGVLVVHRYGQVRFYEPPGWRYREIYSFYTPSRQAGLALADVDGDGRPDIVCGNYWIRAPEKFDLPWRLFAINTCNGTESSAIARLAWIGSPAGVVFGQAETAPGRLALFVRPADPAALWEQKPLDSGVRLTRPKALAAGDWNGDGRPDIAAGENGGPASRLFVFWNKGGGGFGRELLGRGPGIHTLIPWRGGVLAVGRRSVAWWPVNRQRR